MYFRGLRYKHLRSVQFKAYKNIQLIIWRKLSSATVSILVPLNDNARPVQKTQTNARVKSIFNFQSTTKQGSHMIHVRCRDGYTVPIG